MREVLLVANLANTDEVAQSTAVAISAGHHLIWENMNELGLKKWNQVARQSYTMNRNLK